MISFKNDLVKSKFLGLLSDQKKEIMERYFDDSSQTVFPFDAYEFLHFCNFNKFSYYVEIEYKNDPKLISVHTDNGGYILVNDSFDSSSGCFEYLNAYLKEGTPLKSINYYVLHEILYKKNFERHKDIILSLQIEY